MKNMIENLCERFQEMCIEIQEIKFDKNEQCVIKLSEDLSLIVKKDIFYTIVCNTHIVVGQDIIVKSYELIWPFDQFGLDGFSSEWPFDIGLDLLCGPYRGDCKETWNMLKKGLSR